MPVVNSGGALLASFFYNTPTVRVVHPPVGCHLSGPGTEKTCDVDDAPQHTTSATLVLMDTPSGFTSGDVGDELLSGIHTGGAFQNQITDETSYSSFIYFGEADAVGSIRIGAAKDSGDSAADTYFIIQVKRETSPGVLEWKQVNVADDNITSDPF
jgi:hypothetical protein